jgi:hypothetical protein
MQSGHTIHGRIEPSAILIQDLGGRPEVVRADTGPRLLLDDPVDLAVEFGPLV